MRAGTWRRRIGAAALLAGAAALTVAMVAPSAPAAPASRPHVTHDPVLSGTPQVGATLTAAGASWSGTNPIEVTYRWLRCTGLELDTCTAIAGAVGTGYTAVAADEGQRLRVWLHLSNAAGTDDAVSAATAKVAAAPVSTPTPT